KFSDLKEMLVDGIQDMLITQVIKAGIKWVIGLLNPVGAFIKAAMAIYEIVTFFIQKAKQIGEFISSLVDSIAEVAKGNISAAAKKIEESLARAIPLIIGFLASLLGISGLAEKVKKLFMSLRKRVEKFIDGLILKAKKFARKLVGKMSPEQKARVAGEKRETSAMEKALDGAIAEAEKLRNVEGVTKEDVKARLPQIKKKYQLKSMTIVQDGKGAYHVEAEINPRKKSKKYPDGETKYIMIDNAGRRVLREKYQGAFMIRTRMYGSGRGYGKDASKKRDEIIKSLRRNKDGTTNTKGKYWEPEPNRIVPLKSPNDPTVEHRPSVVDHWNNDGNDTNQKKRRDFFTFAGKLDQIKVIDRSKNSELGGGDTYTPYVGDNFKGPGEGE
ncbi:MAG TPA: hypothetical protein VFQ92_15650, partial [Blastocatellia bacterium]|nr:hypothetical protein [Blastocatellia bacterium]